MMKSSRMEWERSISIEALRSINFPSIVLFCKHILGETLKWGVHGEIRRYNGTMDV